MVENESATVVSGGAGVREPIDLSQFIPGRLRLSSLRPARVVCSTCGERWPAHASLPDDRPTACPACRTVQVPTVEPPDEHYFAWASGGGR